MLLSKKLMSDCVCHTSNLRERRLKRRLLLFAVRRKMEYQQNSSKTNISPKKETAATTKTRAARTLSSKKVFTVAMALFMQIAAPTWRVFSAICWFIIDFFLSFKLTFQFFAVQTLLVIGLSATAYGSVYLLHEAVFKDLPRPEDLSEKQPSVSTKILDRNGEVLFKIYADENRTVLPLAEIPRAVIFATIAIEDKDFYGHHGFSVRGIARALYANSRSERLQGGSTITQQLVKNRLLTSQRTLSRKVRELLLAILVEIRYEKDAILEMYLNQVAYGGSAYGIQEAAQKYFLKNASELTIAESAFLAGLPAAPTIYSPFGSNPELAFARQEEVLRRMHEDGYITQEQVAAAKKETLVFNEDKINIQAPHFTMYVKKLLAQQYGETLLNTGGLEVRTTLDLKMQKEAEKIVVAELATLQRLKVQNAATIITKPKTGEILAMVGSHNYFDFANDGQVNVVTRPRQPGSSIKPLTYALALENGQTTQSIIDDAPITYHTLGSPPYSPKNYDGTFHGKVTLKQALASSYNIPAVKTLAQFGINNVIDLGEAMGITTWQDRSRFGLSLTLGGGEVTLFDLSEVYGTFANEGKHTDLNPILEITDFKGTVYYRNDCALDQKNCFDTQVISEKTAFLISNILSDNQARTPAFGPLSTLAIPNQEVAVKTGTTNNLRDNWTMGYTSDVLVGVWVGNNDNTPMSAVVSGVTGASPIWNKLMRLQLNPEQPHKFVVPNGIVSAPICVGNTQSACQFCTTRTEYFAEGTEGPFTCLNRRFSQKSQTEDNLLLPLGKRSDQ